MTVRDALNSAMDEEMERDGDVFVLGEEVSCRQYLESHTVMLTCRASRVHCCSRPLVIMAARLHSLVLNC